MNRLTQNTCTTYDERGVQQFLHPKKVFLGGKIQEREEVKEVMNTSLSTMTAVDRLKSFFTNSVLFDGDSSGENNTSSRTIEINKRNEVTNNIMPFLVSPNAFITSPSSLPLTSWINEVIKSYGDLHNKSEYKLLKEEVISLVRILKEKELIERQLTFINAITETIPFNKRIKELINYHSSLKKSLDLDEINYLSIIHFMKYSIELRKIADEKSISYDFDLNEMKVSLSKENKTLDLYFTKDGHVNFLFEDKDEDGLTRISGKSFFTKKISSGHKISILLNMVK